MKRDFRELVNGCAKSLGQDCHVVENQKETDDGQVIYYVGINDGEQLVCNGISTDGFEDACQTLLDSRFVGHPITGLQMTNRFNGLRSDDYDELWLKQTLDSMSSRVDLTDRAVGKYGLLWKRIGAVSGWSKFLVEIACCFGSRYWKPICSNCDGILLTGTWWKILDNDDPTVDDMIKEFIESCFISSTGRTMDCRYVILGFPKITELVSRSISELELKLTLRGV